MKKKIDLNKLVVNPENYRFSPVDNQEQAIDLMLDEKGNDILALAKHILQHGLDKTKDLRTIKQNGGFLLLDGNRRITALKCLNDPSIISDEKLRSEFEYLHKAFKAKPINKIDCYVFPNEKAASEWIRLDHTGKNGGAGQDSWGTAEKERFSHKFEGKLSAAMQAVSLLENQGDTINTDKLKISTVNRIFASPEARSFLGIDISKGDLSIVADQGVAIERLRKLFDKIIHEDIKVDAVYTKEKLVKFVSDLFKNEKPKTPSNEEKINTQKQKKVKSASKVEKEVKIFVITAFAGLDSTFKRVQKLAKRLLKKVKVFRIDYSDGARQTKDEQIENAIQSSDFLIAILSPGDKEKAAYNVLRSDKNAKEILTNFYPINHNVLLELGYALRCKRGAVKTDLFILVKDEKDKNLPTLKDFCTGKFFDLRNRGQIFYKDEDALEKKLEKNFLRSEAMKPYLK